MDIMTIILISATVIALLWSLLKNKKKTVRSLKTARGRFWQTASEIIGILALIGLLLAVIPDSYIQAVLGGESITMSTIYGAIIGTITIIPAFVAFPLADSLVQSGAYLIAVAAFITTLTMVGFATMPIEIDHFGKRYTLIRNALSFIFALLIALGMGVIL